ncbi:MAG: hypothetical protein ACRDAM_01045 [Casimicrobium sp.]
MSNNAKTLRNLFLVAVFFAFVIVLDATLRNRFGGPMTIDGLPISNASVTGAWNPDFLWLGRAWSIKVQSDEALELKLDGRTYVIPKGSHTVYSNHDHTNTGEFGAQAFWGYPNNVEIRPLDRKQ